MSRSRWNRYNLILTCKVEPRLASNNSKSVRFRLDDISISISRCPPLLCYPSFGTQNRFFDIMDELEVKRWRTLSFQLDVCVPYHGGKFTRHTDAVRVSEIRDFDRTAGSRSHLICRQFSNFTRFVIHEAIRNEYAEYPCTWVQYSYLTR